MTVSIADIAEEGGLVGGPFGSSLVGADYAISGIPVIRGSNMQGRYIGGPFVFVTAAKVAKDLARNTARPGDLVFTQRGTLGQVAMVPNGPFEEYVVSQSQMRLRVDPTKAVPAFVYYACTTPHFLRQIDDKAIRTGVPHTNLGILATLELPRFGLSEQRAIAEVLGALDDKITANRQSNSISQQLRRTLVQSVINPDERWEIGARASFLGRGRAPKYTDDPNAQWVVNQKCVRGGVVQLAEARRTSRPQNDDRRMAFGDLLVNSTGQGTLGRVGVWTMDTDATVDSHVTIVRFGSSQTPLCYAELVMLSERSITALGEGSTGQTELGREMLRQVSLPELRSESATPTEAALHALHLRERASRSESEKLALLRDTLLPALMDGRLRVRGAVAQAEDLL